MSEEQWAVKLAEWIQQAEQIEAETPGFTFDRHGDGRPAFGGWAPWQADGHLQGQSCYLRFRHNQASMTVYDRDQENYDDNDREEILSAVIWPYYPEGHPEHHVHTGSPLDADIAEMIRRLISELAPVSEDNPSSMMILARAVDALTARVKSGEVVLKVNGRTLEKDEPIKESGVVEFVEIDPDEYRLP